uniref:TSC22 domain family protein 1 n=1 Tax=Cairina moschata TaxID=8855 RepID=A0A8C3GQI9_CAIMO
MGSGQSPCPPPCAHQFGVCVWGGAQSRERGGGLGKREGGRGGSLNEMQEGAWPGGGAANGRRRRRIKAGGGRDGRVLCGAAPQLAPRLARRRPAPAPPRSSPRAPLVPFLLFSPFVPVGSVAGSAPGRARMSARCCRAVAMDLGVYQLRHFSISFLSSLLGTDSSSLRLDSSSSGASVVAIDNKIEQAMDLVKSHLMYAVREEVEVLKEQIKELIEKNSQLEQENTLLKTLASPEQLAQFQAQLQTGSPPSSSQSQGTTTQQQQPAQPASQGSGPSA